MCRQHLVVPNFASIRMIFCCCFFTPTCAETVQYEKKNVIEDMINREQQEKNESSCQAKSGNYVAVGLIVSLITFLSIGIISNATRGVIDKNVSELGVIVGLTALNMFLTPILLWTVGYRVGIISITKNTSKYILLLWLFALIIDFMCLANHLPSYSFFYIFYVIIKIILMPQFYSFGEIDMKWFGSGVIQSYVNNANYLKNESKILRLWPWVVCIIVVQMCLFNLGCLAFVGDINTLFAVKIILFCLLVWSIKVLTHLLHYVFGRMITFSIDPKSRIDRKTNSSKFLQTLTLTNTQIIATKNITDPETKDEQRTVTAAQVQTGLLPFFTILHFATHPAFKPLFSTLKPVANFTVFVGCVSNCLCFVFVFFIFAYNRNCSNNSRRRNGKNSSNSRKSCIKNS